MDQAFRDAMAAGYALTEPPIILGSPMHAGEVASRRPGADRAVDAQPARADRRRDGHRQDEDPPAHGRPAVEGRRAVLRGRYQGRPDRAGGARRRDEPEGRWSAPTSWPGRSCRRGHPVEFLSLSGKLGAQVRATVHSFGPLLLGKVLDLNDTQTSILALIFKYCDDNELPLLDLDDLDDDAEVPRARTRASRSWPTTAGCRARRSASSCGRSSSSSRRAPTSSSASRSSTSPTCSGRRPTGEGMISVLELSDVMDQPRLFSTFMLWMLAQLYESLPEVGDLPKPKLCFFFDEAHLLFDDASDALMDQVERTARLIRSKGVGVYFVTQAPTDVPSPVLAQLGQPRPARPARLHPGGRRRAAQDGPDVPDDRRSTTSRRRSPRSGPARRSSRSCRRGAFRRRSRRPGSSRRTR